MSRTTTLLPAGTELLPPEPPPPPPHPQGLARLEPSEKEKSLARASIIAQVDGARPEMISLHSLRPVRAQRAAHFAWIAPVAAVGLAAVSHWGRELYASATWLIAAINAVLLVVGLVSGVAALVAIRRPDRPGVAGPAVVGICISMMLSVFGVAVAIAYGQIHTKLQLPQVAGLNPPSPASTEAASPAHTPDPVVATAPKPQPASVPTATPLASRQPVAVAQPVKQTSRDESGSAIRRGSWRGVATAGPATLRLAELPADAGNTQRLLTNFDFQVAVIAISIDNTRGTSPVTIDPSSLRAESPDGHKLSALPARAVLETAHRDREGLLARNGKLIRAEPGQLVNTGMAFFMSGTSFQDVNRMTLVLNGRRVGMSGRFVPSDSRVAVVQGSGASASAN